LNAVVLPAWTLTAIAVVPGGAYPSYAQGYYRRANSFYTQWDEISRDRDRFRAWMQEQVLSRGPEAFRAYSLRAR
jgi:glutaconate CoA-transferase subunit A